MITKDEKEFYPLLHLVREEQGIDKLKGDAKLQADSNLVDEIDLKAFADNQIVTDNGITTDGYLNIHSEFGSGFHYNNFALIGN